jgi:esterase/lipase
VCPVSNASFLADRLTRAESVTMRIFKKSAHVLACDYDRDDVAAEVVSFLKKRGQMPVEP